MDYLDETDKQIIHALMDDARHTTATMIAEDLDVSDGTVRNRIERLEEEGVIRGYTAMVDFEKVGHMKAVFICTAPGAERERLSLAVQSIPGVIHIRVLMLGRPDLQVVAVGEDTTDLRRIAESLSELDITIEDEELVQSEIHSPYAPFGPVDPNQPEGVSRVELVGETDMLEVALDEGAPVAGRSVQGLREDGVLAGDATLISVGRDAELLTPSDDLEFASGDILTVLPQTATDEEVLEDLLGEVAAGED